MSVAFEALSVRLAAGQPLTDREAEELAGSHDLVSIGMLADEARRRRHGGRTTFVRVFEVGLDAPLPSSVPPHAGEVRLVGKPDSVAGAEAAVRAVAAVAGGRPLTGFALDDLRALARAARISLEALARHLREAGLEQVAELPVDQLEDAIGAVQAIAGAGLAAPRAVVRARSQAGPLDSIRGAVALQRATGAIRVFAPLPREIDPAEPTTGYDDVRQVALARLVADNIASIQVDWSLYGPKLAQVALTFGADDVDAVSAVDSLELGARRAPLEEVLRNIRAASLEPDPRDGRFEPTAS
jgi:aminodeoxyfutalosine synthase